MKLALVQEMRDIDKESIEKYGIPEIVLMENASREIARSAEEMLDGLYGKRLVILAGTGNNGGDAFAAARYVNNSGAKVKIFLLGNVSKLSPSAKVNYDIVKNMGMEVFSLESDRDWDRLNVAFKFSDGIIDGIIGTGFKGELRENAQKLIKAANNSGLPILAIDVPSGVDADNGEVATVAIQANTTMTLGLTKWGTMFAPGAAMAGKLIVDGIGIPQVLLDNDDIRQNMLEENVAKTAMLVRPMDVHKGSCGRILVIGGSKGMTGAAVMASEAALRAGAGLVTLACAESLNDIFEVKLTEVMTKLVPEVEPGVLGLSALESLLELAKSYDLAIIGPGLGRAWETQELVKSFVADSPIPLVIDADALYAFSGCAERLAECKYIPVLTPHLGELSRLISEPMPELRRNLLSLTRTAAKSYNAIIVAKSECTMIVYPDGQAYATVTGNPGMATAGCGDVLAGAIGGLYKQCMEGLAPLAGVYVHGRAGDLCAEEKGYGLTAGDILGKLPLAIREIRP